MAGRRWPLWRPWRARRPDAYRAGQALRSGGCRPRRRVGEGASECGEEGAEGSPAAARSLAVAGQRGRGGTGRAPDAPPPQMHLRPGTRPRSRPRCHLVVHFLHLPLGECGMNVSTPNAPGPTLLMNGSCCRATRPGLPAATIMCALPTRDAGGRREGGVGRAADQRLGSGQSGQRWDHPPPAALAYSHPPSTRTRPLRPSCASSLLLPPTLPPACAPARRSPASPLLTVPTRPLSFARTRHRLHAHPRPPPSTQLNLPPPRNHLNQSVCFPPFFILPSPPIHSSTTKRPSLRSRAAATALLPDSAHETKSL